MKTLHLVLKSKWFDKIAAGEKTSEYRACTPYWNNRFMKNEMFPGLSCHKYKTVVFHRGYTNETMEFNIRFISLTHLPNDLHLDICWEIKLGERLK